MVAVRALVVLALALTVLAKPHAEAHATTEHHADKAKHEEKKPHHDAKHHEGGDLDKHEGPTGRLPNGACGCMAEPACACRALQEAIVIDNSCACAGQPACGCQPGTTALGFNEPMGPKAPNAIPGAATSTVNEHEVHKLDDKFQHHSDHARVPHGLTGHHKGSRCGCVHMPKCPCRRMWVRPEFPKKLKFTSKNISPDAFKDQKKKDAKHKKELADADAIALGKKQVKANKKHKKANAVKSLGPKCCSAEPCGGVSLCAATSSCGCQKYVQLHLITATRCPCFTKDGRAAGWVEPQMAKKKNHRVVPHGSLSCCSADPCDSQPRCPDNVHNVAFSSGMSVNVATGIN